MFIVCQNKFGYFCVMFMAVKIIVFFLQILQGTARIFAEQRTLIVPCDRCASSISDVRCNVPSKYSQSPLVGRHVIVAVPWQGKCVF